MDNAYVQSPSAVLKHFDVQEASGLDKSSVTASRQKHGRNGMSIVYPSTNALSID